jgi:hypothetical protein
MTNDSDDHVTNDNPTPTTTQQQQQQYQQHVAVLAAATSHHVYVKSKDYAWVPARLLETNQDAQTAKVSIPYYREEQAILDSSSTAQASKATQEIVQLTDYPNHALLLQNVNEQGQLKPVEDMVDLPFLHEVRSFEEQGRAVSSLVGWLMFFVYI